MHSDKDSLMVSKKQKDKNKLNALNKNQISLETNKIKEDQEIIK